MSLLIMQLLIMQLLLMPLLVMQLLVMHPHELARRDYGGMVISCKTLA